MLKSITIQAIENGEICQKVESFYNDVEIRIHINDYVEIVFICLDNDLESLVYGYLGSLNGLQKDNIIQYISMDSNNVFVTTTLSKDEFLVLLHNKEMVQTCQSIHLKENQIDNNKLIIPFNNNKIHIKIHHLLESCKDFYPQDSSLYYARILFLDSNGRFLTSMQSYDTNPENAIYKAVGLASKVKYDLLDSIIFINFRLSIEELKKIIYLRITFVVFIEKPSFSVLKIAQKFGLTLVEYIKDGGINIITHPTRIK